jgi:hypothetical protein
MRGMEECNQTEPVQGSDSPFSGILQDSNTKMQDRKGVFGIASPLFYVVEVFFFGRV